MDNPSRNPGKHSVGSIYDLVAPTKDTAKKDEWNKVEITAKGSKLVVKMNGEKVNEMDLDRWTDGGKNPDGTKNKFAKALKDFKREGHIGFQDHGSEVMYRNSRSDRPSSVVKAINYNDHLPQQSPSCWGFSGSPISGLALKEMPQLMVGHRGQPLNQVGVKWPLDPPYRITRRGAACICRIEAPSAGSPQPRRPKSRCPKGPQTVRVRGDRSCACPRGGTR